LTCLKEKGFKIAIASNRPTRFTHIILRALKVRRIFDKVLCADRLRHGKPNPLILNKLIKGLKVRKDGVLYAGDMALDIETGRRAHVATGRLRILAVTAAKRSPALPDIPTIAEAGVPGYRVDQWYGAITGVKVPPAIVKKLHGAMLEALKAPDLVQRLGLDGSVPVGSTPNQFAEHIKSEIGKWRKLVKDAGLVLQQ